MKEHISLLGAAFLESIMMKGDSGGTIPKYVALKLCAELRNGLFTQCWGMREVLKGRTRKDVLQQQTRQSGLRLG
jgi:hypothetical protein